MNVFFLERRTAPSGTFTRTGPRSGSARRGSATLLVKILVATVCFCGSFAYLCRTMRVRQETITVLIRQKIIDFSFGRDAGC